VDAGVAADLLRLQHEPSLAEMQLQVLAAWTAVMHKDHAAHQQQQLLQQALPAAAGESSSNSSSSSSSRIELQHQQPKQPAKQQWRADLLPIPAFHQDLLPLLPGGQTYLDTAARAASNLRGTVEERAVGIRGFANCCCCNLLHYLQHNPHRVSGQQQLGSAAGVVSAAAVRLVLELQLLAAGAVQQQRQRQHQVPQLQQQQQQPASPSEPLHSSDLLVFSCRELLQVLVRELAAAARSCLPPKVLQQAGLQLLQALAAPLQQLQLSGPGGSFYDSAATSQSLPDLGEALYVLVTAACGAQLLEAPHGER
jgi:hypothetical protein